MSALPYAPRQTPFNQRFWDTLRVGKLITTACRECRHKTFPPKIICPACWSRNLEWTELLGTGHLRSFTEVWAAPAPFKRDVPYTLGLVDLVENLRLLTRIEARYEELVIDEPVVLAVHLSEPVPLFYFRPTTNSNGGADAQQMPGLHDGL